MRKMQLRQRKIGKIATFMYKLQLLQLVQITFVATRTVQIATNMCVLIVTSGVIWPTSEGSQLTDMKKPEI